MEEKSIKKNALWAFTRAFFSSFFPVITFPYASRILLPEGIGRVNFSNSIVNYFIMLASLGIGTYGIRESAKLRDNKQELTKFVKEILAINFISSLISYLLLAIVLIFVPKTYEYRNLILLSSTNILLISVGLEWFYKGIEEFKYITIRNFIFQCIGLVYLFIFVKSPDDCAHYVIFGLFTSVGSNIFNLIHSTKFLDYKQKINYELIKHIKPVMTFFGMSLVTSVYEMLDTTMLGFLSTDTEIGYYSAANKLNWMFLRLITAATTVLLPRLSYCSSHDDLEQYKKITNKIFGITNLFTIPVCFGILVLAKPIILLFSGESFIPATTTMYIISPLIFIMAVSDITGIQILPSKNKEKVSLISYIAGAITNLILNITLIPKYGSVGAAIGSLIAELIVALIQLIYLRKSVFNKELFLNLFKVFIASSIMFLGIYFIMNFFENIILQIIISFICGIVIYYLVLKLLKTKELLDIENQLKSYIGKKMKDYKLLTIDESKQIEVNILTEFDSFCEKNDLKYYLAYGTLLGSIRHKGFIPWDDDIDIFMPRPDYDRFIEMTKNDGISPIYDTVLYSSKNHKSIYPFAKIIDNTTLVFEKGKSKKHTSGLWVDLFPLDGFPENYEKGKEIFQKHLFYRHLQDIITTNPFTKNQSFIKKIIKYLSIPFIKIYGLKRLCRKMDKVVQTYDYETNNLCTNILWAEETVTVYKKSDFEPYEKGIFEGQSFRIPKNYDKILREYYGDYMILPPEDQRIPHEFIAYKKITQ